VQARREFPGEDKRAWRGYKTRSREWADPGEARTESGIVFYVSENGERLSGRYVLFNFDKKGRDWFLFKMKEGANCTSVVPPKTGGL